MGGQTQSRVLESDETAQVRGRRHIAWTHRFENRDLASEDGLALPGWTLGGLRNDSSKAVDL